MRFRVGLMAAGSALFALHAHAQDALVESAPNGAAVTSFQFLNAGDTFSLSSGQVVEIGYLSSCIRETITGGSVTVGQQSSDVSGGDVIRETLPCGAKTALSEAERNESGASAWRNDGPSGVTIVANLAPVLLFATAPSSVRIERTDIPGRPIRLATSSKAVDLAARGVELAAGGIYAITAGTESRTIEIDFDAIDTGGPAFLRAVRF